MFTQQELNVLLTFLRRTNITGTEAEDMVYLKNKIGSLLQAPAPSAPVAAVEAEKVGETDPKA